MRRPATEYVCSIKKNTGFPVFTFLRQPVGCYKFPKSLLILDWIYSKGEWTMRGKSFGLVPGILLSVFLIGGVVLAQGLTHYTYIKTGTVSGINYATGGIGVDERQALDTMAKDYNLKLIFETPKGHYLADVMVAIAGSGGDPKVNTQANGPWFFANLPAGTYKVTATFEDKPIVKTVQVGSGLKSLRFVWQSS
jgi:hypothetical protein